MDKRTFYDLLSEGYDAKYSDSLNIKMRKEEERILMTLPLGLTLDIAVVQGTIQEF